MTTEQDKQHLQELAAYRFTVENLRARVAELEAHLAAVQQGVPAAKSGRQVIVDSGALQMVLNALERDALEGKQVRAEMRLDLMQSITHPTQQGLEQFIEKLGDVHFQRCRVGSKEGEIRWDIEFGHYGAEVRGKTLREAITKALAAQAKQGGA